MLFEQTETKEVVAHMLGIAQEWPLPEHLPSSVRHCRHPALRALAYSATSAFANATKMREPKLLQGICCSAPVVALRSVASHLAKAVRGA